MGECDIQPVAITYEDFLNIDEDVTVCGEITDAEIITEVIKNKKQDDGEASGEEDTGTSTEKISVPSSAAMNHIKELRHFFESRYNLIVTLYIQEVVLHADSKELPQHHDLHGYNSWHRSQYTFPAHHLSLYEKRPSYISPKLSNYLPAEIRNLTEKMLKRKLNDWLSQRLLYSLQDYLLLS
ncbi:hypothetical protein J6590_043297 [Homalodisca vitripennis]|nr:hypothetical protein J6590_043297 [Homalodisca vitripennis]